MQSSEMDDIPLKDLLPIVKARKRQVHANNKVVELVSPKSQENQESVRSKLRESLVLSLISGGARNPKVLEWADAEADEWHGEDDLSTQFSKINAGVKSEMFDTSLVEHASEKETSRSEVNPLLSVEDIEKSHLLKQAESVALNIEAELFRHFGGVNQKYKKQARSLLFNLKDRSNPELRRRVLSGEITPQNLCAMSAEQLASKQLSQWRMAKAEELAQKVVLTDLDIDSRRLVKKTHKGEFEVQIEHDYTLAEVETGGQRPASKGTHANGRNLQNDPDVIHEEQLDGFYDNNPVHLFKVRKIDQTLSGLDYDKASVAIASDRKHERKQLPKLWEGSFQFSGSLISPVLAYFKSGEKTNLSIWPRTLEVKGRVRLDALEKFLQDLHFSRTRAVMIISCCMKASHEGNTAPANAMREVSNQYQKVERVGFAEPAPGFELYLFPFGGSSLKLLSSHGYSAVMEGLPDLPEDEDEILVGCVVWRRIRPSSSNVAIPTPKTSSHYYTANKHALSGRLHSPTQPDDDDDMAEIEPSSSLKTSSTTSSSPPKTTRTIQQEPYLQTNVSVASVKGEQNVHANTPPPPPTKLVPDSIPPSRLRSNGSTTQNAVNREVEHKEEDDDLPPGFGPVVRDFVVETTAHKQPMPLYDDDDDLPEYDLATGSIVQYPNTSTFREGLQCSNSSISNRSSFAPQVPRGEFIPPLPKGPPPTPPVNEMQRPFECNPPHSLLPTESPSLPSRSPSLFPQPQNVLYPLMSHQNFSRPPPLPFAYPPQRLSGMHFEQRDSNPLSNSSSRPTSFNPSNMPKPPLPSFQARPPPNPSFLDSPFEDRSRKTWEEDDMPEWIPPSVAKHDNFHPNPNPFYPLCNSNSPGIPNDQSHPPGMFQSHMHLVGSQSAQFMDGVGGGQHLVSESQKGLLQVPPFPVQNLPPFERGFTSSSN